MNIYDVSKKSGYSIATVSRVMNGNPNVSDKARKKINAVMDEMGYTPNVFARGLGLNTMNTIGIMCSDSSDIYLANAVYFIERELRQNGYDSILCCTGYQLENKRSSLNLLLSKRVDAVILVGSSFLETTMEKNDFIFNAAKEIPIMLINGHLDHPNIYSTVFDDYQAVYDVVQTLIQNGKKDIVYLHQALSYSGQKKLDGYKAALLANDFPIDEKYIIGCTGQLDHVKEKLTNLWDQNIRFDSVIASDDILGVGAVKFAKSKQLLVPDDLNIIGYNNSLLSQCCEPELTSIDNKVETLSIMSVTTLMRVFQNGNVPSKTMISGELVKRDTTNFN